MGVFKGEYLRLSERFGCSIKTFMKAAGWLARAKQKDSNAFGTIAGRGQKERLVVEVLEMMCPHQSPHDKVLWKLANKGKMTRSILRQHIGMKQANLDIILADLEKDGRIIRIVGKHGKLISLRD